MGETTDPCNVNNRTVTCSKSESRCLLIGSYDPTFDTEMRYFSRKNDESDGDDNGVDEHENGDTETECQVTSILCYWFAGVN